MLILDAYSSDSLPVHLLTREALQLYLSKLSPHGIMAFNVSNRHLELEPLMAALARDLNMVALNQDDSEPRHRKGAQKAGDLLTDWDEGKTSSQWIVLARNKADFGDLSKNTKWQPAKERPGLRAWTDGYSSLISIFKWR